MEKLHICVESFWETFSTDTFSYRLHLLIHTLSYSFCLKDIQLVGQIFRQTASKYVNNFMSNLHAKLFRICIVFWFYSSSLKLHRCGTKAGTYFTWKIWCHCAFKEFDSRWILFIRIGFSLWVWGFFLHYFLSAEMKPMCYVFFVSSTDFLKMYFPLSDSASNCSCGVSFSV